MCVWPTIIEVVERAKTRKAQKKWGMQVTQSAN